MFDFFKKLNWTTILSFAVAIEMQIGNGSMSLAHMFPDVWIPIIQAWSGNLATIGAVWMGSVSFGTKRVPRDSIAIEGNTALAFNPGPLSDNRLATGAVITSLAKDAKVVGALLLAIMLASMMPFDAFAQGGKVSVTMTKDKAPTKDPLSVLKTIAINDAQAALDDATANQDQTAIDCWTALLLAITNAQNPLPTKLGAFLALQKARDAVRGVDMFKAGVGPLADLKNKCAAVIVDTNTFLVRLGVLSGGAAFGF
jgi:hypothetical protein